MENNLTRMPLLKNVYILFSTTDLWDCVVLGFCTAEDMRYHA